MGLECVMIIMDNSVYSRNGDVVPNRFQAQQDAISSVISYKTNENLETCVGLMTMGGDHCEILTTPTNSPQQIYSQFSKLRIHGRQNFSNAIQIAQLSMKHRVNKNQKERIVVFIASELTEKEETLLQIARNFRRNNTNLDIINIACEKNLPILTKMIEIVNVENESRLINFNDSNSLLVDCIKQSAILGHQQQNVQGDFQNNEFMDEELQMVLRLSLEEEQKRLKELEQKNENEENQQKDEEKIEKAENLVTVKEQEVKPELKNQYLNDPKFIQEILGELNIEDKDKALQEIINKKNSEEKDEQKDDKKD